MKANAINRLARDWRVWAQLDADVVALVVRHRTPNGRKHDSVSTIPRPEFPKGVCRKCGCTEFDPCVDAIGECCAWADDNQVCCNFCKSGVQRRRPGRRVGRR